MSPPPPGRRFASVFLDTAPVSEVRDDDTIIAYELCAAGPPLDARIVMRVHHMHPNTDPRSMGEPTLEGSVPTVVSFPWDTTCAECVLCLCF